MTLDELVQDLYIKGHLKPEDAEDWFTPVWSPYAIDEIHRVCSASDSFCEDVRVLVSDSTPIEINRQVGQQFALNEAIKTEAFRSIVEEHDRPFIEQQKREDNANCAGTMYEGR